MKIQNIAVRFFVCSGVVLSALYLIWPATEVRAGTAASAATLSSPAPVVAPAVLKSTASSPLTKVSLDQVVVPVTSTIRN